MVGSFLGHGPWEGWNGQWLTLVRHGEGFELQEVTVSSTRDDKPVCGDVGFTVDTPVAALGGCFFAASRPSRRDAWSPLLTTESFLVLENG